MDVLIACTLPGGDSGAAEVPVNASSHWLVVRENESQKDWQDFRGPAVKLADECRCLHPQPSD